MQRRGMRRTQNMPYLHACHDRSGGRKHVGKNAPSPSGGVVQFRIPVGAALRRRQVEDVAQGCRVGGSARNLARVLGAAEFRCPEVSNLALGLDPDVERGPFVLAPNAKLRALVLPREPAAPALAALTTACEANCAHHPAGAAELGPAAQARLWLRHNFSASQSSLRFERVRLSGAARSGPIARVDALTTPPTAIAAKFAARSSGHCRLQWLRRSTPTPR